MTPSPELTVRILIVEDQEFANTLNYYLSLRFPSAHIAVAKTVAQATALIQQSKAQGTPFDLAILDFRLPANEGDYPTPETGIRDRLREVDEGTQIIRVTSHSEDDMLIATGEDKPDSDYLQNAFLKKEGDPSETIGDWVLRAFHTRRIRAAMSALLCQGSTRAPRPADSWTRPYRMTERERSLDFSMFFLDAGKHWDLLTPRLQDDLAGTFGHVQLPNGMHLLGVIEDHPASGSAASHSAASSASPQEVSRSC